MFTVLFLLYLCLDIEHAYQLKPTRFVPGSDLRRTGTSLNCAPNPASAALWRDQVDFVDLSVVDTEPSENTRELPLFLLGSAFYPQGNNFLNVFEMKYRTMMFDCAKGDDSFGYIYTDSRTGQIASIGTMCKIIDRQLLPGTLQAPQLNITSNTSKGKHEIENHQYQPFKLLALFSPLLSSSPLFYLLNADGRQYIAFQGTTRFRVKKIVKTLPYVLAEVETNIEDEFMESTSEIQQLELDVYNTLKYYVRLMKTYPKTQKMMITQAAKQNRPLKDAVVTDAEVDMQRRSDFSFSLANMIQMGQPKEGQLLLQTRSVVNRLEAEKLILLSAVDNVCDQLMKINVIDDTAKEEMRRKSLNDDDDDSDILPPDVVEQEKEEEADEWDMSNIQ